MISDVKTVKNYPYILLGFVCILLYYLPYFILGQDSAFRITDYLDDEIIQYLYNGKYVFASHGTIVEEWLSGAPLASIQPPTFTLILFFKILPLFEALIVSSIFGTVGAFLGMYLLVDKILKGEKKYVTFVVSVLFCILPYYPPYGLSSVGIPLVIWALMCIYEIFEQNTQLKMFPYMKKCIPYFLVCIFYALSASLVLVGYFVVGFSVVAAIIMLIKKKKAGWAVLVAAMLMTIIFCIIYRETVMNVLFQTYVSHRSDPGKIREATSFVANFVEMFKYGQYHAPSLHTYIMAFTLLVTVLGVIFYKKFDDTHKKQVKLTAALLGSLIFIAIVYAFLKCEAGIKFRKSLGPLESFQVDRIFWLNPTLWYIELALSVVIFYRVAEWIFDWVVNKIRFFREKISEKLRGNLINIFRVGFIVAFGLFFSNYIIHHICSAEYYSNIRRIKGEKTDNWTYNEFFDHELFDDVADYIGKEKSEYRIGCVGFVPAIAQANGFYTVDGYSNNYPLEYKRKFRGVIEKELEKNAYIKNYYDNWGSRCYIFTDELEVDYFHGKDENVVIENLEINTDILGELGCNYIFSTVEIKNADDINLNLLNVFTRENSRIEIYLYEI